MKGIKQIRNFNVTNLQEPRVCEVLDDDVVVSLRVPVVTGVDVMDVARSYDSYCDGIGYIIIVKEFEIVLRSHLSTQ